jgi:hypothetical protein
VRPFHLSFILIIILLWIQFDKKKKLVMDKQIRNKMFFKGQVWNFIIHYSFYVDIAFNIACEHLKDENKLLNGLHGGRYGVCNKYFKGEIASYYFKRLKKTGINIGDITMLSFEKQFNCKIQTFKCCVTFFCIRWQL